LKAVAPYIIEDNEPTLKDLTVPLKKIISCTFKDHHFHAPMRQTHVKKSVT
jgi:hypothetical protein